jgi:quercetin dioxygenase-like cupin family protein
MKATQIVLATALIIASALTPQVALAQQAAAQPGIKRTDLMKEDLSIPGREVVQVLVEFAPGVTFPRHSHPGEELVYVTEGLLEYQLEGRQPVTLKAGDVLFIPHGTPHAVKNVGPGKAAEIATYIVEKGKPPLVLSK